MNSTNQTVCFNANGLKDRRKTRMVVECCLRGKVDVLGLE